MASVDISTKKAMSVDSVNAVLAALNSSVFGNRLEFARSGHGREWCAFYSDDAWTASPWAGAEPSRVFWLNSDYELELRHGGGTSFHWWVDACIVVAIAKAFDGTITDDSDGVPYAPDDAVYSFANYLRLSWDGMPVDTRRRLYEIEKQFLPEWILTDDIIATVLS